MLRTTCCNTSHDGVGREWLDYTVLIEDGTIHSYILSFVQNSDGRTHGSMVLSCRASSSSAGSSFPDGSMDSCSSKYPSFFHLDNRI